VTAYYAAGRLTQVVALAPKRMSKSRSGPSTTPGGERLQRVEIKALSARQLTSSGRAPIRASS